MGEKVWGHYGFLKIVMSSIANITLKRKIRQKFLRTAFFFIIVLILLRNNFVEK